MKDQLISREDIRILHPVFRGRYGETLIDAGVKLSGLNNANDVYDRAEHLTGISFCRDLLDNLNISRVIRNPEILEKYKNQPFITVSNHPYGHIDGIALIEAVGRYSDQFRLLVNSILGLIDTLEDNFIIVNPLKKQANTTLNGLKQCFKHLKTGNSLGFFPSGAVSYISLRNRRFTILDRDWRLSIVKLIRKAAVPVIPIHISGRNSIPFYLSRVFGWKVRDLLLCHELKNKEGREIVITIGDAILPESIQSIRDNAELGEYLRQRINFTEAVIARTYRKFYNKCDLVYIPTLHIAEELKGHGVSPQNFKLWQRGINTSLFSPAKRDRSFIKKLTNNDYPSILFVSRLVWEKNLETLFAIYDQVQEFGLKVNFLVAGDGIAGNDARARMKNAFFLGFLQHETLVKVYASSDIFVFTSISETYGNVVIEAMASGCVPVIARGGGMEKQSYELITGLGWYYKVHVIAYRNDTSKVLWFLQLRARITGVLKENPGIRLIHLMVKNYQEVFDKYTHNTNQHLKFR